jgi:hypothetical protein
MLGGVNVSLSFSGNWGAKFREKFMWRGSLVFDLFPFGNFFVELLAVGTS